MRRTRINRTSSWRDRVKWKHYEAWKRASYQQAMPRAGVITACKANHEAKYGVAKREKGNARIRAHSARNLCRWRNEMVPYQSISSPSGIKVLPKAYEIYHIIICEAANSRRYRGPIRSDERNKPSSRRTCYWHENKVKVARHIINALCIKKSILHSLVRMR